MTFAEFGSWSFFAYLGGCFIAFALSLRYVPDNRILAFTYGAWITAAYAAHHILVPHAAQTWGHYWYWWNAAVSVFPILPAWMLKDAGSRKPVIAFGICSTVLCVVYASFSLMGERLPGIIYFYVSSICEACQILSMIIWSGPVVPVSVRAWKAVTRKERPWMHLRV